MRKIVAGLFMSLDGVVESPQEWQMPYFSEEMMEGIAAGVAQADAILIGRRTYLEFADFWPKQGSEMPLADFMNSTPKYVASSTLDEDDLRWENSTLITGDLYAELTKLKRKRGKNIQLPGSPRLVRSLLRDGMLDELSLNIHPIVVGSGLRFFDEVTERIPLELADSMVFSTGVIGTTFRPTNER